MEVVTDHRVTDLSKPLEEAASINKSPGALAVIHAAERDPGIRTAMVVENGMIVASYVREDVEADEPWLATYHRERHRDSPDGHYVG